MDDAELALGTLARASWCSRRTAPTRVCAWCSPGEPRETAAAGERGARAAGVGVTRLEPVRHSLEQRFLEITSRLRRGPRRTPRRCRHERAIAAADDRRRLPQAAQEARHADLGRWCWRSRRWSIFFIVRAIQHSSTPAEHGPAGGIDRLHRRRCALLALFFGPLAAILIGVEAGAGDASAGVFRDLVVTGRSRLALFASRVPAALALCWR